MQDYLDQTRRMLIDGMLKSDRFTIKSKPQSQVLVLRMDRPVRFALTNVGIWSLGAKETSVDDLSLTNVAEGKSHD